MRSPASRTGRSRASAPFCTQNAATIVCVIRAWPYDAGMPPTALAFGPFQIDERSHVLLRNGEAIDVTDRHAALLLVLASHSGAVLSKDALVTACWGNVAVTENSIEQAISRLRRVLGRRADGRPYIETVPRRG